MEVLSRRLSHIGIGGWGEAQAGSEDAEVISIQMVLKATGLEEITKGVHVAEERV